MSHRLLSTKITLPPLPAGHVPRQRLLERIALHPDARLVLFCAPAGYGKSSCLLEWCHALKDTGTRVIWYALDRQDNDPARFASYLGAALQKESQALASVMPGNLEEMVTAALNSLSAQTHRYILILDDYHLLTNEEIHAALSLMLEHLPSNVRFAIASRADPPLQLSRLRVRGQMVELRLNELRFTSAEIARFFQQAVDMRPSPAQITQLDQVCEGWAAALRLMTLSLHSTHRNVDEAAVEHLLNRYSTARQHIFDYFFDEVFVQQPDEIREFLLATCVLDQFSPDLCAALTHNCAAPLILNRLAQGNLFLIPLSDTQPVYRYHHLIEDFLRQRLQFEDPERYHELHRTAAQWHENRASWVEAVNHALAAQDQPYAAWLIEERAWEALTSRGEIMTILGWRSAFTVEFLPQRPRLCLYFSRAFYLTGDLDGADTYVQMALHTLRESSSDLPDHSELQAIAWSYQATLAGYRGEITRALTLVNRALSQREHMDHLAQVRLVNTAGYLYFLKGEIENARRYYREARDLAGTISHAYLQIDAEYYLAQLDLINGKLDRAAQRCEHVLKQYRQRIAPLSAVLIPLALVCQQRNDLTQAEACLREAVQLARAGHIPDILWYACLGLADLMAVQERFDAAGGFLRQAANIISGFRSPVMESLIGAAQARLALRIGDLDDAAAWADDYFRMEAGEHLRIYEDLTFVRVRIAQRQSEAALKLLDRLLTQAESDGRWAHVLECEILRALAHDRGGRPDAALAALQKALAVAESEGYLRIFLDDGQPVIRLLKHAVEAGISTHYAGLLLLEAEKDSRRTHPADVLTEREQEVLCLLAEGATNQDIVDALVISIGTVKSHVNRIMSKLDARNRTEAVAKARSLGLLPD
jgi:LuxR family transcriptional regulator, maltose regulon positive regulatory protein